MHYIRHRLTASVTNDEWGRRARPFANSSKTKPRQFGSVQLPRCVRALSLQMHVLHTSRSRSLAVYNNEFIAYWVAQVACISWDAVYIGYYIRPTHDVQGKVSFYAEMLFIDINTASTTWIFSIGLYPVMSA